MSEVNSKIHAMQLSGVTVSSTVIPHVLSKEVLRDAWIYFLRSYPLDWFCTLTFAKPPHPETADKAYHYWINKLNRSLYGKRWKQHNKGVYWVRAEERTKNNVIHYHVLLGDTENLNVKARRLQWMDEWFSIAGIARIEEIDSHTNVVGYVTKYILKDCEIELSDNMVTYARQSGLRLRK